MSASLGSVYKRTFFASDGLEKGGRIRSGTRCPPTKTDRSRMRVDASPIWGSKIPQSMTLWDGVCQGWQPQERSRFERPSRVAIGKIRLDGEGWHPRWPSLESGYIRLLLIYAPVLRYWTVPSFLSLASRSGTGRFFLLPPVEVR